MTETPESVARYVSLGKSPEKLVPLAFTVSADTPTQEHTSISVGWTSEGFAAFRELRKALGGPNEQRNLPHRALIALLEMYVPHITSLDRDAGLGWKPHGADVVRFAWTDAPLKEVNKSVSTVVREWVSDDIQPLVKKDAGAREALERVKGLYSTDKLFTIEEMKQQLYPWAQLRNGTANPTARDGYPALADFLARTLERQVVFEGLPPLRHVVGRRGFGSGSQAELVTEPITDAPGEPFSLRLTLKVASLPGVRQPVVLVDVSKRRWVRRLDPEPFGKTTISGYAFPTENPLAVRFSLEAKNRKYELGDDYSAIQRRYHLKGGLDGLAIAGGEANNELCELYVNYRNGYGRHSVKAGVPELDKIEAFEKVEKILTPLGFRTWESLEKITTKHGSARESGLVNAKVLKQEFGLIEVGEDDPTIKMLDTSRNIVVLNKYALDRHHTGKPILVVAYHETCRRDAELVKRTARYLMGNDIEVTLTNLPNNSHGPRYEMPSADERNAGKRARARLEAWRPLAEPLKKLAEKENILGCLVIAPKFYEVNGEWKRDDTVNKPAGRKAIASIARVPVQYLLPADDDLDGFLTRAQYAWRDLAWAHRGRVDGVAERVCRLLPDKDAPREIIGITVVQRNDKRVGWKGSLIPVAFKLDVAEGQCFMRFAYEDGPNGLHMTDWEPIQESLSRVAELSPLTIGAANNSGKTRELRRQRFQEFCETVITDACDAGTRPLVLTHSTHSASYWKWLTDAGIDPRNIDFEKGTNALQQIWSGVRIVRVRENNSPQIVLDKEDRLACITEDDPRKKKDIQPDENIRVPTSPSRRLYRVTSSSFPTYLTVGGKDLHQQKRGRSCYRETDLLDTRDAVKELAGKTKGDLAIRPLGTYEVFTGQWPTPNALELVVAFKQEDDNPDAIAELVEGLRFGYGHYGEWSSLPAPLFFERVVRDYIAEFQNEEETEEGDDQ
jgi:hypothetical protein